MLEAPPKYEEAFYASELEAQKRRLSRLIERQKQRQRQLDGGGKERKKRRWR